MDPNNISDVEKIISFVDVTTLTAINAFLTGISGIIAVFVAWIGFRGYRLSRAKFNLDLFNHRYDLYKKTEAFANKVRGSGSFTNDDINQFGRDIEDVKFFYSKDIYELMSNLHELANDHHCYDVSRSPQITLPIEQQNNLNKMNEIKEKITNIQKNLNMKMNEYLHFEKWK